MVKRRSSSKSKSKSSYVPLRKSIAKSRKVKRVGKVKSRKADMKRKAKPPGWRKSKNGNWYYENRRNRSDVKKI